MQYFDKCVEVARLGYDDMKMRKPPSPGSWARAEHCTATFSLIDADDNTSRHAAPPKKHARYFLYFR